jgi:glycosyltransferase involved in cell wall biosynthesis
VRVTLLAQFFPPETFAGANRIAAMAAALAAVADVQVVTVEPSYPNPSLYRRADPVDLGERVALRRTGTFVPHGRSLAARAIGEQRMAVGLLAAAARIPADVVVASSPGMFLGPAGLALSRLRRVPFVWDIRDITWEYARERTNGKGAGVIAAALERSMWSVARRADLLAAATPGIHARLSERRLDTRVLTIGNAVGPNLLPLLDPSPPPVSPRPVATYAGLVGQAQDLGVLCDVAALAPEIDFHVAGDGPERATIEAERTRRGLANLTFHGYLSPEEVARLYHRSTVLFAQLHRSNLHTVTALPSKLHEYMAAGRPVVYAGDGLAARTIATSGAGVAVEPGDAFAIATAIRSFATDAQRARSASLAGRRTVEHGLSRSEAMAPLVDAVGRLALERRR